MKILIADDHRLFRDTLQLYIESVDKQADVKMAFDLNEAVDMLENDFKPDIVLLDLVMPGMNGIKGLKKVVKNFPDTKVALLSGFAEYKDVENALKAGAKGFFPKTISGNAFIKGIREVIAGRVFMPVDHNTEKLLPSYYSDTSSRPDGLSDTKQDSFQGAENDVDLTPREHDVLKLLMDGGSNKDIAKALGVQVVTVKLHVSSLFRKFGARNRTQVVLKAQSMGYNA